MDDSGSEGVTGPLPEFDDTEQQHWQAFLEASLAMTDQLNRALVRAHELTLFDVMVLQCIRRAPNQAAAMGDIAAALVFEPSRLTYQIRVLESRGLVARSVGKRDKRNVMVSMTGTGHAQLAAALKTYARLLRTHFLAPLTRQQMVAMSDSCRRIIDAMKTDGPPRRRTRE